MKAQKKSRAVWMVAAEIPQDTHFMMSEITRAYIREWPRWGLGDKVTKYFSHFEKDFCQMNYLRHEFDTEAEFLSRKMLGRPTWALRMIDIIERNSQLFMRESKKILYAKLRSLSDRQLIKLYKKCFRYHKLQHVLGSSVSWHADAEKERVTRAIWSEIEGQVEKRVSHEKFVEIFSVLTTPRQESFVSQEEKDFLKTAILIHASSRVKKLFSQFPAGKLEQKISEVHPGLSRTIQRHYAKYRWLAFQYRGPATPIEEYFERWKELIKSKDSPGALLQSIIRERSSVLSDQKEYLRRFRFSLFQKKLILLAQRMVYIKGFRKDALYHGMYCYEPLFKEIGRRIGLTINQIWAMNAWEIPEALLRKQFNVDELNARQQRAICYVTRRGYTVLTGRRAQAFLKGIRYEKRPSKNMKELRGTPACPGKARGVVRIINIPEDMAKMRKGDILVAHNTNPNLVPAMKKAAALVSESGGLTCHTAIVARELRTPCIVGVPGADKILKDGDKVVVDATNGTITKL